MKRVAIIDSGSGGINVLAKCLSLHPCFNYLLYLDDKNLPYGDKNKDELVTIAENIVLKLEKIFSPEIIIIACNTLTCVTLDYLRAKFPKKIFIGTYPNVSQAKNLKKYLILATKVTIQNSALLKDCQEHCLYLPDLPKVIDDNLFNRENIKKYLLTNLPKKEFEGIVLGCTHFEGIKEELSEIYPSPMFFDGSDLVASSLQKFSSGTKCQVQIISSPEKFAEFYNYFSKISSFNKFL